MPPGIHTVTPYLIVKDVLALLTFLTQAFYAVETHRTVTDTGRISNAIVQMGDASFMLAQPQESDPSTTTETAATKSSATANDETSAGSVGRTWTATHSTFCLYAKDPDALYDRALSYGALSITPMADQDHGDRQGGVQDCAGNIWWLTKRLVDKPYE